MKSFSYLVEGGRRIRTDRIELPTLCKPKHYSICRLISYNANLIMTIIITMHGFSCSFAMDVYEMTL